MSQPDVHSAIPKAYGPQTVPAQQVFSEKYCSPGETYEDACRRLAWIMAEHTLHQHMLEDMLLSGRFLPAGRLWATLGTNKHTTPFNCFVSGTIADSFVDDPGSIMQRAVEAAATMRMGGGIGYDFSTLRPRGDKIKKLNSNSSGPISFMRIFNEVGLCVASSGHRRGAQMGILRVDHPDILEFVLAKQNANQLTGFNISVAITDKFMEAVIMNNDFDLTFEGKVYKTIKAKELWHDIMRSTWDWAEPGVIFIDTINRMNNLAYCETITATNPCSEQPLPPHGACLLGSFNLAKYVKRHNDKWAFDYLHFEREIGRAVLALDNVIDQALYPLPEQAEQARLTRRMGLGITGAANAFEALGYPYGSQGFTNMLESILAILRDCAYRMSTIISKEKGPFPLFNKERYMNTPFITRLPRDVLHKIAERGIRNSHLVSIAPTGTISFCADNISSGIEPVFAHSVRRTVLGPEGSREYEVKDYGVSRFGTFGKTADKVSASEHLDVLCAAQKYVDSAVSKTCNVGDDVTWDQFKDLYMKAWLHGAKGCTTFRAAGKRMGVMFSSTRPEDESPANCPSGACEI